MKNQKRKRLSLLKCALMGLILWSCQDHKEPLKEKYEPNWESLKQYEVPKWFKDAKLGIFIHWSPSVVPDFSGGGWYARNLYMPDSTFNWTERKMVPGPSDVYLYHKKTFGDITEFGYKDLIPLFTGDKFDAKEWISLFKKSGAKYVVPIAEHHDGFAMYNSKFTKWNAVNMGPKRDVLGELLTEAKAAGLHTGASSHFAFNWNFYRYREDWDTMDPEFAGLYGKPHAWGDTPDQEFLDLWWNRTKDIIDQYQPDILWFDFFLDKPAFTPYHPKLAAYFYNSGVKKGKEVVLQTKNYGFQSYPEGTHVLDLERGLMDRLRKDFWQTDTSIGTNAWHYKSAWVSRTPNSLIDDFIDMVSKNGSLLLNVGPKVDGTIPDDQKEVLLEIGKWLDQNGEAIYGSRPWKVYGEGPTQVTSGHKTENGNVVYTAQDIRFTTNAKALYAIILDWPEDHKVTIKSLSKSLTLIDEDPLQIELLGAEGNLSFSRGIEGLRIDLPTKKTNAYAPVLKIRFSSDADVVPEPDDLTF